MKTIYFSKTNGVSDAQRIRAKELIAEFYPEEKINLREYTGGKYDTNLINSCDEVFCVSHKPIETKVGVMSVCLGRGTFGEVKGAMDKGTDCWYCDVEKGRVLVINEAKEYDTQNWKECYGVLILGEY